MGVAMSLVAVIAVVPVGARLGLVGMWPVMVVGVTEAIPVAVTIATEMLIAKGLCRHCSKSLESGLSVAGIRSCFGVVSTTADPRFGHPLEYLLGNKEPSDPFRSHLMPIPDCPR
jgi:hypothetical protein